MNCEVVIKYYLNLLKIIGEKHSFPSFHKKFKPVFNIQITIYVSQNASEKHTHENHQLGESSRESRC
jgi:hypothetical protein